MVTKHTLVIIRLWVYLVCPVEKSLTAKGQFEDRLPRCRRSLELVGASLAPGEELDCQGAIRRSTQPKGRGTLELAGASLAPVEVKRRTPLASLSTILSTACTPLSTCRGRSPIFGDVSVICFHVF